MEMVLHLNANHHVQNKGRPGPGKQDKHVRMINCLMKKMKMMALMMMNMTVMMKKNMKMKMMALMMKKMMVVMMKKKL